MLHLQIVFSGVGMELIGRQKSWNVFPEVGKSLPFITSNHQLEERRNVKDLSKQRWKTSSSGSNL